MKIVLHRKNVTLTSGTGQLILMQAGKLKEDLEVVVWCAKGALRFFMESRIFARSPWQSLWGTTRVSEEAYREWLDRKVVSVGEVFIIEHGRFLPQADIIFIHNLLAEASRHLDGKRTNTIDRIEAERKFFRAVQPSTLLIANSQLVRKAMIDLYSLAEDQVKTVCPGYNANRFNLNTARRFRSDAREKLNLSKENLLLGFITSGDFHKRGLDIFLGCAEKLAESNRNLRFLVLGSKKLPTWAQNHPLMVKRKIHYQPKCNNPEFWLSSLDLFLYPARIEEFGMVISEALAMGIPVLTSRRVGASELIPAECEGWVMPEPDVDSMVSAAKEILCNIDTNKQLAQTAAKAICGYDGTQYAKRTLRLIEQQIVQKTKFG